jgi:hypothetical protein
MALSRSKGAVRDFRLHGNTTIGRDFISKRVALERDDLRLCKAVIASRSEARAWRSRERGAPRDSWIAASAFALLAMTIPLERILL